MFRYAILTISDTGSRGERVDASGDTIAEMMDGDTFELGLRDIVPDERDQIAQRLSDWCDSEGLDLLLTTGGTGLGPRDVTPEATRQVLDVEAPGIAEAMRMQTLVNTPLAMLSRSTAGVRSGCLIVNLPGSPKAVRECLEVALPALPHALEMVKGWRTH